MTSRFILNLRLVDYDPNSLPEAISEKSEHDSLRFEHPSRSSSLLGNIGAPLDLEGENERILRMNEARDDDDEEE